MELSRAAVLMISVVGLSLCGAGEGKIKTTHKELKCSCCVSVASEMKAAVLNEWETHSGATILIEKVRFPVNQHHPQHCMLLSKACAQ